MNVTMQSSHQLLEQAATNSWSKPTHLGHKSTCMLLASMSTTNPTVLRCCYLGDKKGFRPVINSAPTNPVSSLWICGTGLRRHMQHIHTVTYSVIKSTTTDSRNVMIGDWIAKSKCPLCWLTICNVVSLFILVCYHWPLTICSDQVHPFHMFHHIMPLSVTL